MSTDDLAAHISGILEHPDTPTELYNAVADELMEMSDQARTNVVGSPEVLRVALPLILAKRAGGKRARRAPARTTRLKEDKRSIRHPNSLYRAANQMVAILSSPDTPKETRAELGDALFEFAVATGVNLDHPELVRLAYLTCLRAVVKYIEHHDETDPELQMMYDTHRKLITVLRSIVDSAPLTQPADEEPEEEVIELPDVIA